MPLVNVGNKTIVLEYVDSGRPKSSDHQTVNVAVVHGHSWGAGSFYRSLSLAPSFNIRLFVINRRGFGNSSPFTPEERAVIQPPRNKNDDKELEKQRHRQFFETRVQELAVCLHHLASKSQNGKLTLMGWSLGNAYCIKLMDMMHDRMLNVDLTSIIQEYIIYDAPYWALSVPPPLPSYANYGLQIMSTQPSHKLKPFALNQWLGAHFSYNLSSSTNPAPEEFFLMHPRGNMGKLTTMEKIYKENLYGPLELSIRDGGADSKGPRESGYDPRNSLDDNYFVRGVAMGLFDESPNKILFKTNGRQHESRIGALYCKNSAWILYYGNWVLERKLERDEMADGFRTLCLDNANHFVHWEDPELFLKSTNQMIDDLRSGTRRRQEEKALL